MEGSWRSFRMLFTLEGKIPSMDFGLLQKEFLGALPSGFEGRSEETCLAESEGDSSS